MLRVAAREIKKLDAELRFCKAINNVLTNEKKIVLLTENTKEEKTD